MFCGQFSGHPDNLYNLHIPARTSAVWPLQVLVEPVTIIDVGARFILQLSSSPQSDTFVQSAGKHVAGEWDTKKGYLEMIYTRYGGF